MERIIESLKTPQFVTKDEISSQVIQMVNEIKANGQTFGRSDAILTQHVISGCILEVGVAKAVNGIVNRKIHDPNNPNTFAWDVEVENIKIEVKPSPKEDKWFNFNIRGAPNQSDAKLSRADLTSFIKYKHYTDFLVAGYYEKSNEGWMTCMKWLIDSREFEKFVFHSNGKSVGTTHYYHIKNAISNNFCIDLK